MFGPRRLPNMAFTQDIDVAQDKAWRNYARRREANPRAGEQAD
jgi:hypothetical protein